MFSLSFLGRPMGRFWVWDCTNPKAARFAACATEIHAADHAAFARSDSQNHWQVQSLSCCLWDVHTFRVALVAQRVEVQVNGVLWAQMSKGAVWKHER